MSDCVGCGYCCSKVTCEAGRRIYGPVKLCPALIWSEDDKRHYCSLAMKPGEIGERYRKELSIGAGCSSAMFNDWRENIQDRTGRAKNEIVNMDKFFKLFLYNLGKQWISKDVIYLTVHGTIQDMARIGTPKEVVNEIVKEINHILTENRSSYLDSFF